MNTWETIAIIIIYFWRGRTWRDSKGLFFPPIGYRNVPKGWTRQWYFASAQRCDPSHFFSSYSACLSLKFLDKAPAGIDAYRERERERKKNEEVRLDKQMTDNHQPACTHTLKSPAVYLFIYICPYPVNVSVWRVRNGRNISTLPVASLACKGNSNHGTTGVRSRFTRLLQCSSLGPSGSVSTCSSPESPVSFHSHLQAPAGIALLS